MPKSPGNARRGVFFINMVLGDLLPKTPFLTPLQSRRLPLGEDPLSHQPREKRPSQPLALIPTTQSRTHGQISNRETNRLTKPAQASQPPLKTRSIATSFHISRSNQDGNQVQVCFDPYSRKRRKRTDSLTHTYFRRTKPA